MWTLKPRSIFATSMRFARFLWREHAAPAQCNRGSRDRLGADAGSLTSASDAARLGSCLLPMPS